MISEIEVDREWDIPSLTDDRDSVSKVISRSKFTEQIFSPLAEQNF